MGSAMLETVTVLPVLLLVIFGGIEFSIAFGRFQIVSNAARAGARAASLARADCDPRKVEADIQEAVRLQGNQLGIFPPDLVVTASGLCSAGTSRVEVRYRHSLIALPRVGVIPPFLDLRATSVSQNEG